MTIQLNISTAGHPAHAQGSGEYLVIAVHRDYLKHLVETDENHAEIIEHADVGEFRYPEVTDPDQWLSDVAQAINEEGEDGANMVTRMLSKAFTSAIEWGAESIQLGSD